MTVSMSADESVRFGAVTSQASCTRLAADELVAIMGDLEDDDGMRPHGGSFLGRGAARWGVTSGVRGDAVSAGRLGDDS